MIAYESMKSFTELHRNIISQSIVCVESVNECYSHMHASMFCLWLTMCVDYVLLWGGGKPSFKDDLILSFVTPFDVTVRNREAAYYSLPIFEGQRESASEMTSGEETTRTAQEQTVTVPA